VSSVVVVAVLAVGVGAQAQPAAPSPVVPIDYADPAHWITVPMSITEPVDVFYVPPTMGRTAPSGPGLTPIDDPKLLASGPVALDLHASAFMDLANVYAPFYRQADAVWSLALPADEHAAVIGGVPAGDVEAALRYYLDHWNDGRPFFLLSHSQGSDIVADLLGRPILTDPAVADRLVAAYVVGYSITDAWLEAHPQWPFAAGADDTGVVVSWNTVAAGFTGQDPVVLPGALVINPISWVRDETPAGADQALGSRLPDGSGGLEFQVGLADATLDLEAGVVRVSTIDPASFVSPSGAFPEGVLHSLDIPLYWGDLAHNAAVRWEAWLAGR
jgi:hypothetical protein